MYLLSALLLLGAASSVLAQLQTYGKNITGISLDPSYAYKLPQSFLGNITQNFVDTNAGNATINNALALAKKAAFYEWDSDFSAMIGPSTTIELIGQRSNTTDYAYEAGVWLYDHNQIWFTSGVNEAPTFFSILDLNNYTITTPVITVPGATPGYTPNWNGGYYFNGTVYFTASGNESIGLKPGIYSVDPVTLEVDVVLDSYFGVPVDSIDDIVIAKPNTTSGSTSCSHAGEVNMFMTALDFAFPYAIQGLSQAVLPNAVFRFSPQTQSLQGAISRADILVPNGVALDPTGQYLYVTDTGAFKYGIAQGANSSSSSAVFRYTLDADCNPTNKILFSVVRSGIADGIKVDDLGRVWTASNNGLVVTSARGKELGVWNAEYLLDESDVVIANFAFAGNNLIILSVDRVWIVSDLAQNLTSASRFEID